MTTEFECTRCGTTIRLTDDHTEIVRRDFVDEPQPTQIEYLCSICWKDYEAFLEE